MIERLTRALIEAGLAPEAGELADLLWLMAQRNGLRNADRAASAGGAVSAAAAPPEPHVALERPDELAPDPDRLADEAAAQSSRFTPIAVGMEPGSYVDGVLHVRGVAASGMPASVAGALQAFFKRTPAPSRHVLDEEATAEEAVETGVWLPVMDVEREYGWDLVLVMEEGETSPLWTDAVGEFAAMLATQAAFHRVHRLRLDPARMPDLIDERGNTGPLSNWRGNGITHVLYVSDILSPLWRDGTIQALLRTWCEVGPVTLLQPMPRRAWRHLPLGLPELKLSAYARVQHNRQLSIDASDWFGRPPPNAFAVPVIGFDATSLRRWAEVMTGHADVDVPGFYLVPGSGAATGSEPGPPSRRAPSGPERVAMFRQMASPGAYELAVHLSVMDELTIPVMRLVQRIMHPDSGAGELAEVFLGGLLEREPVARADEPERKYRFIQAVREALITSRRKSDERKIDDGLEAIDERLPPAGAVLPVRSAYFRTPTSADRQTDWALPLSAVSRAVLSAHTQARGAAGRDIEIAGIFDRNREIRELRPEVRQFALDSEYALADDEIQGDMPLLVTPEVTLWLVALVRDVLVVRLWQGGMTHVADTIPVEQLILVDAAVDGEGRGWLTLHQRNRTVEYDAALWPDAFRLQLAARNLGLASQAAKVKRLQNVLLNPGLSFGVEEFEAHALFWKIAAGGSDASHKGLQPNSSATFDVEAGWLAPGRQRLFHVYDGSVHVRTLLRSVSARAKVPPHSLSAVPFRIPTYLKLFRIEPEQVDALMNAARDLKFDSRHAIDVICNTVRSAQRKANGIAWQNAELGRIRTRSLFLETFDLDDVVPGPPFTLNESEDDPAADFAEHSEDADAADLALWLTDEVDMDRVRGLADAMLKALTDAVDSADWDVEATSHMLVEPEDAHGILESWKFAGKASRAYAPFEVVSYEDGMLTVTRPVTATVRIFSTFEFSVKDGIDKDIVGMGSTEAERHISVQVDAEFGFAGVAERQPRVEWVEIQHIVERVDFGYVEPDDFFGSDDEEE